MVGNQSRSLIVMDTVLATVTEIVTVIVIVHRVTATGLVILTEVGTATGHLGMQVV